LDNFSAEGRFGPWIQKLEAGFKLQKPSLNFQHQALTKYHVSQTNSRWGTSFDTLKYGGFFYVYLKLYVLNLSLILQRNLQQLSVKPEQSNQQTSSGEPHWVVRVVCRNVEQRREARHLEQLNGEN